MFGGGPHWAHRNTLTAGSKIKISLDSCRHLEAFEVTVLNIQQADSCAHCQKCQVPWQYYTQLHLAQMHNTLLVKHAQQELTARVRPA